MSSAGILFRILIVVIAIQSSFFHASAFLMVTTYSPHYHGFHRVPVRVLDTQVRALSSDSDFESPRKLVAAGMNVFQQGTSEAIQQSIDFFNRAENNVPDGSLTPFLWQRGISYYYSDDFGKGSEQFRFDVKVNPLDVEEIVWDIACLQRLDPKSIPPKNMMALPEGKKDRRKIMSTVYSLFRGQVSEGKLALVGHSGSSSDEFYALFYLGLYCESIGERTKAEHYMKAAKQTIYATTVGAGDYMTSCARVHCKLRGWV